MHHRNFTTVAPLTCGCVYATLMILSAATPARGETGNAGPEAFNNNCRTCHSAKEGDNRLGPSLDKVVGRKAGTAPGYSNYSQGLKNSGIVWDETTLDKFITNPDAVVPNNNMKPFKGVSDATVRAKIIAFLKASS
ncbi:MAG: cytochrome c [Gammaproteobacteria bacterium]|nr:cytochrome c [Gammaproteobacteria bacterium]